MVGATQTTPIQSRSLDVPPDIGPGPAPLANQPPAATGADLVHISPEGRQQAVATRGASPPNPADPNPELSPEEQRQVTELKQRDQAVKAHEQAHMAAGGGIVQGGATYQFERGPDGNMYAVGGEVKIDSSAEADPAATIRKMAQVRRAALAPMDPSATDRTVAAKAYQMENQARAELARQESDRSATASQVPGNGTAPGTDASPEAQVPGDPMHSTQKPVNIMV